ncbi:MAG: RDD family protein [Acidimicrobiaceae bacterium]|nr:RDD family protein [Acidimicrobiaceae bacterium]
MSEYSDPQSHDEGQRTGWAELPAGGTVKLASAGARFGARVFDVVLLFAVDLAIILVNVDWSAFNDELQKETPDFNGVFPGAGVFLVLTAISILYEVVPGALWGRTLGKRVVGIKIVKAQAGEVPGWGRAIARWAIPGLPLAIAGLPVFGLGIIWIGWLWWVLCYLSLTWDRVYQGWHDRAAGTLVIKVAQAQRSTGQIEGVQPEMNRVQPDVNAPYSGLAIAAMVCGICGFITWGIAGVVGIVLAVRAKRDTQFGGKRGEGMRVAGLVCGIVSASILAGCTALVVVGAAAGS